jgi:hypothetical protein
MIEKSSPATFAKDYGRCFKRVAVLAFSKHSRISTPAQPNGYRRSGSNV